MIAQVEQMVMEDRHLTVKQIAVFHHDKASPYRAARVHQFFDNNLKLYLMLHTHLTLHQATVGCFQH
jgi:hypothetical protein